MSQIRTPRHLFPLLVVLCLAFSVQAQETNDAEMARQLASTANDNAITPHERQDALKKLQESAQLFLSAGEKLEAARVLNRVGRLHLLLESGQDAISAHNQALLLLKETPSVEVEVDNLNGLAAAYMGPDISQVEPTLNRSIMLSEQAGYTRGKAEALLTLSTLQNYDNHAVALRTAQEALALWKTLGDKQAVARNYELVGDYYLAQNMLAEATQSYEQALQLWRELGNSSGQASALTSLGFINLRRAEWQSALARFAEARGLIDEKAEPATMGSIECGMAELYNPLGVPELGLTHYGRALDYFRQTQKPNPFQIWYATRGLGWTYYLQHKYSDALAHLKESLAILEKEKKAEVYKASTQEDMAKVYLELGDYPAALQSLQFALDVYSRAGNPMEAARTQGLIGNVFERQGQLARARRNYVNALATFQRIFDRVNEASISHALGRIELKSGNYKQAEEYLLSSIGITEKMQRISTTTVDLRTAFYGSVHDRYQTYIEYLMSKDRTSPNSGLSVRAFEISESARARSLAEFFRATHKNSAPGIDPDLAQKEKSLRQSLTERAEYRSTLLRSPETKGRAEDLAVVNADLPRLETEYNEVIATINKRYPAYEQLTQPAAWSLRRIQEEVIENDQTMLLEYSLGVEKSYAWAVTRDSIKVFELAGRTAINDAARKLSGLLVLAPLTGSEDKLNQAARELSELILAPLASELNKQVIIVAADGGLHYIPFQILPLPSSSEPLVSKFEIINAPSASILGDLRLQASQRQRAARLLAAFGDPVFQPSQIAQNSSGKMFAMQPGFARLRSAMRDVKRNQNSFDSSMIPQLFYAARELANLRELAGNEALVLSDVAATRESLLKTDLAQFAILHLATHGIFDPERPEDSGLLLSMTNREGQQLDGFVGLQDIYDLRAPVMLVVLSACETALGRDVQGEGLVGVTRGFMYAGASSVVSTLWKVDDAATAELMKLFYSNMLRHGMKPSEALRAAQNSIRRQSNWSSPYYWAAFTLQGEYRQSIKPVAVSQAGVLALRWKIAIGVGLLVTLASLGIWYRRRSSALREN